MRRIKNSFSEYGTGTHSEQKKLRNGFKKKSWVEFDNCAGCVDGMLVWISKPSKNSMLESRIGPAKYFYGRKKKFGLNLQAICDHMCRFIDIDIDGTGTLSVSDISFLYFM